MGLLTGLPQDLLKLVAACLEQPGPLLRCCRAFAALQTDAHAFSLWAVQQRGPEALLALMRSSIVASWPLPRVREAVSFVLELVGSPQGACSCMLVHWAAVKLGDAATLQLLLSSNMHPLPDARMLGGQLLTDACAAGHAGTVAVLLNAGAEPRPGDTTAMQAAAENGHLDVIRLLLAWGRLDPRAGSNCALRMAARRGHADVVAALAAAGCDPRDRQDEALSLAVAGGHVQAARTLIDAGADACSRAGMLLLAVSCAEAAAGADERSSRVGSSSSDSNGSRSGSTVESGTAANICGSKSDSRAAGGSGSSGSSDSRSDRIPNSGSSSSSSIGAMDCSPARAAQPPHCAMLQLLWEAGAKDEGGAALCAAAAMGRDLLVQQLLALMRGGGVGLSGGARLISGVGLGGGPGLSGYRQQLTAALHAALSSGHLSVAERLLHAGAGVDASLLTPSQPFTDRPAALALLARFPNTPLCPPLSGRQGEELLAGAATETDEQFVNLLLRWGADATASDCQALRRAVLHGRAACVRAIMHSAGVAALQRQMPCCVMRVAVQGGHLEVVSELVDAGLWPGTDGAHHCCADPSTCAARMLCVAGCPETASLLLRRGGAQHAGTALRLVACGRAPSWRSEAVVVSVMDAMVKHGLQQLAGSAHRSRGVWGLSGGAEEDGLEGGCSACRHEEEGVEEREGEADGVRGKGCGKGGKVEQHCGQPCTSPLLQ